jgi:hypothetical protein
LGNKAAAIRDQEAYGGTCETFDQWIKSEGYGHSFVYDCMKAARLYGLMAPVLEPRGITLDCESHFRDISADTTPKEAKAIAGKVLEMVEASGSKVTRKHFAAAAAAVRPKPAAATRPDVPDSIEAEIADREPAEESVHSTQYSVEPETPPQLARDPGPAKVETAEVCEVQPVADSWDEDLRLFKRLVADHFQPLFQKHGHSQAFLSAAATAFRNWSEEVAHRQPTRRAK